eukprot:833417-Rhodomonas_salina.2
MVLKILQFSTSEVPFPPWCGTLGARTCVGIPTVCYEIAAPEHNSDNETVELPPTSKAGKLNLNFPTSNEGRSSVERGGRVSSGRTRTDLLSCSVADTPKHPNTGHNWTQGNTTESIHKTTLLAPGVPKGLVVSALEDQNGKIKCFARRNVRKVTQNGVRCQWMVIDFAVEGYLVLRCGLCSYPPRSFLGYFCTHHIKTGVAKL